MTKVKKQTSHKHPPTPMASKHSPASSSTKRRQSMLKTEQKKALVAKRLSMLQHDAENHDSIISVSNKTPLQYEREYIVSESNHGTLEKLKSNCYDSQQKNCESTNIVRVLDEESPCDSDEIAIPCGLSDNQTNHKRAMVVSDDDSEEDGKMQCLIQPIKKERMLTKRKKLNHESESGGSDNSGNLKMECKFVEQHDNTSDEKFSTAMDRANKVQANLSAAYPSFVKMMLPSHVSGCFWLHMPSKFCHVNLPKEDCIVMLIDESGREFKTNYLVHKRGLSGGWRGFSIHHDLQKGDVLVFHLVDSTTFKVYIIRNHRLDELDGALGLLELDICAGQMISGDTFQKVLHTEDYPPIDSLSPSNTDIDLRPEVLDGIRFSDADINFEAIKGFENFNIIVDGLVIDSKFSHVNLKKYYELCRSQSSFLHQHLLKGLNCNLVVGIILETINIADAIIACTSSTSIEDLRTWKTTLDGFELLGMKVSFLCSKLNLLLEIADESNMSARCTLERASASKRMRALEDKIMELKGVMEKIDSEIEAEMKKHAAKIKEIANTPW